MAAEESFDGVLREELKPRTHTYRTETVYDDFHPEDFTYEFAGRSLPLRDPIFTPIFTSILTSAGLSLGAAQVGGAIAAAIASTAVTAGLQTA